LNHRALTKRCYQGPRHKKASITSIMLIKIPHLVLTIVVFFTIIFFIHQFLQLSFDFKDLEMDILEERLMQSVYYHDTLLSHAVPFVVSPNVFQEEFQNSLMHTINPGEFTRHMSGKVVLTDLEDKKTYELLYNKEWYMTWETIYQAGWQSGKGGVIGQVKNYPVQIYNEASGTLHNGNLEVSILMPNS